MQLNVIKLEKNKGVGNALRLAVNKSRNEWIVRMDSDDISVMDRFQRQLTFIYRHPEIDIIGGDITEFIGSEDNVVGKRTVPKTDWKIKIYMKTRCAMNHDRLCIKIGCDGGQRVSGLVLE